MKKIILAACAVLLAAGAQAQSVDEMIGRVLESVEANNAALAARGRLTDAQSLEARTGNSLENPEVEFGYKWGKPSTLGENGEIGISQGFDFPSTYVYRNRLARSRAEQYGHEYAAYRQQLLLEAQTLCIEIISMRQKERLLMATLKNAENINEMMQRRLEAGDANALEANKAAFELIAARNAFQQCEIEFAAAFNRLENLNGGQATGFDAGEFPSAPVLMPKDDVVEMYRTTSPEILAALSERDAAGHDVRLSRSQSLPRFSAGFRHEWAAGEKFNGVAVGMSIPLFGNRNNVKRARAQAAYAEVQYQSGLIDMSTELDRLYAEAALLSSTLAEYRKITRGVDSISLLNRAMEAGQISVVEYFAELAPIYDAYLTMIEVERDYHTVCAQINMIGL